MKYFLLPASCALLFLFSCGSSSKVVKEKELGEIVVSTANNEYRSSEPKYWDITHTDIYIEPFQKKNDSFLKEAKGEVHIKLHPYCYASDSLVLDAKSMDIDSVTMLKPFSKNLPYSYQDDKLTIRLGQKFYASDTIDIYIRYTAKPYAESAGGSRAISEDRGLYYINANYEVPGKPKQIWTQGETQSNSHWFPTFDQPNEKFTVSVSLLVPDDFTTLSSGALVKSVQTDKGRIDKWEMNQPIQAYVVMFAIGKFDIVKDREWNGKEVNYYVEKEYAPYAKLIFKNTPDMIDYFSKITGVPYPWNKYSQVVVRDYVSGAMENTSASLFGEFVNQNAREIADKDNEDVVSHELFHQWFGDYATAESWSNLTLNESFANYGEQLWRKHQYGDAPNDQLAYEDLQQYIQQAAHEDPPLVRYYYHEREDMFDRVSYQKGGAILHYLNGLLGDSAFYKAMQIYLSKNAYGNAEASDWRKAVEAATGTDWHWFFNQWYYRGGHPELRIDYSYDDTQQQLTVSTSQVQADSNYAYRLPLKAKLVYGNEEVIIDWNIEKKRQSFTYNYRDGVRPFFVPDIEHWLVGTMKESKQAKEWARQFEVSTNDYISKRRSINGAFYEQKDTASKVVFYKALKDKTPEIRAYALSLLDKTADNFGWRKDFSQEVKMLAMNDGNNKVRANAYKILGDWKVTEMEKEMMDAINDNSYAVAGAALNALGNIDSVEAAQKARAIAGVDIRAELQDAVWQTLARQGNANDWQSFEQEVNKVYGRKKISLASEINFYLTRVQNEIAFEKGLEMIAKMTNEESIKSYRYAIGANLFGLKKYFMDLEQTKNKEKATWASSRIPVIEKYINQIIQHEQDSSIVEKYKQL